MEHRFSTRACYADTDSGGAIYHARYVEFCERARFAWFYENNLPLDRIAQEDGFILVVAGMKLRFRRPGTLGNEIEVRTRVTQIKSVSFILDQSVYRIASGDEDGSGETLLCQAEVSLCGVNRDIKPTAIPENILALLQG